MLIRNEIRDELNDFFIEQNLQVQEDFDQAADKLAQKIEEVIYSAIKSLTITIQPSQLVVISGTPGSPATNATPIILNQENGNFQ